MYVSMYVCVYVCIYLYIYLFIYLYIYLSLCITLKANFCVSCVCSQIISYCRWHTPRSTSNAFLFWYVCSTELKTGPNASDTIIGMCCFHFEDHCKCTRFLTMFKKTHFTWLVIFCAVPRERGVNTFLKTHDLLRSYTRTWTNQKSRKHSDLNVMTKLAASGSSSWPMKQHDS